MKKFHPEKFGGVGLLVGAVLMLTVSSPAKADDSAALDAFEKTVRPLLVEKCQSCHGAEKAKGGLRLTDRASLLKGGDGGPVLVPNAPEESRLIQAVRYADDLKMPPKQKLSAAEVQALERWVAAGAPWPASPATTANPTPGGPTPAQRRWWAFQPIRQVVPPTPHGEEDSLNEIDAFLREAMRTRGVAPASLADRRTWIRRATFDLTGLPPSPDEVDAFLADDSPLAFDRVVERLLASPAYGERWARHWLDVARYADYYDSNPATRTASCELTEAWRYRDWVVDAFNRDLPFDQFVAHQIAGDLMANPEGGEVYPAGLIATTFLSNGVWDRGDADKEKIVSDMVDDQIDTVGKAFLGLTLGCARCHDHKFDPVSQEDYYALAGVFYSTHILKDLGAKGAEYVMHREPLVPRAHVEAREKHLASIARVEAKLAALEKQPRTEASQQERAGLSAERDRLKQTLPAEPPLAMAAREGGTPGGLFPGIQDVPVHIRGSYTRLGPLVKRRLPRFLAGEAQAPIREGSGRKELARWVASAENPLTPRVIVNRVWQWHFGEGLVRTPNNFGMLSEPPSHPDLLDWLAARFVADGWSLKALHRRIMLSAAYRRSSVVDHEAISRDPENRWLGRFTPRRLDAEEVRDAILSVSGRLDRTPRGPAADGIDTPRRSLYVQTARWDRSSFAMLFDAANPDSSTEKRTASTVAPQALMFLNHPFVRGEARRLAGRLNTLSRGDADAWVGHAFLLLYGRPAKPREVEVCKRLVTRAGRAPDWEGLAHVLLCSNELMYVD
ncbi:MAG: PSD1 and planctomycete cytochrome C domain-containing protein [Isosphaeraceae bacterium]